MDLLTEAEEPVDRKTGHLRVDIRLLADGSAQWRAGAIQPIIQACVVPRRTPKQPS
jgi:hypothetical protein